MRPTKVLTLILIVGLALGLTATDALAGADRLGTAGVQQLRIPPTARGASLGGSVVSDAAGLEAIYWNPAGLAAIERSEAMLSYSSYIADMSFYMFGAGFNTDYGTFGFSFRGLDVGEEIEVTTEAQPDGTGQNFNPFLMIAGVTYANQFTEQISVGASASVVHDEIHEVSGSTLSFDFGIQYKTPFQGLGLGIVFKNFGPGMNYDGAGLEVKEKITGDDPGAQPRPVRFQVATADQPTYVQFGVSYDAWSNDMHLVKVQPTYRSNGYSADEFTMGLEYSFQNQLFVRTGLMTADQDEYMNDFSFGAGLKLGDFTFDYAYGNDANDFLGTKNWYTLKFAF
ncbi:MAG: hypothetical protein D6675_16060 [Gemmatimonadetes bacterium]|nr:MAG: hypothetical protein D6675_16060 [Gemmatimonadota bacterium]